MKYVSSVLVSLMFLLAGCNVMNMGAMGPLGNGEGISNPSNSPFNPNGTGEPPPWQNPFFCRYTQDGNFVKVNCEVKTSALSNVDYVWSLPEREAGVQIETADCSSPMPLVYNCELTLESDEYSRVRFELREVSTVLDKLGYEREVSKSHRIWLDLGTGDRGLFILR